MPEQRLGGVRHGRDMLPRSRNRLLARTPRVRVGGLAHLVRLLCRLVLDRLGRRLGGLENALDLRSGARGERLSATARRLALQFLYLSGKRPQVSVHAHRVIARRTIGKSRRSIP